LAITLRGLLLGNVLFLTAEDDPSDTVSPRLAAAEADEGKVKIVQMIRERDPKTRQERPRMFNDEGDGLVLARFHHDCRNKPCA
jgi:hypothetical protein